MPLDGVIDSKGLPLISTEKEVEVLQLIIRLQEEPSQSWNFRVFNMKSHARVSYAFTKSNSRTKKDFFPLLTFMECKISEARTKLSSEPLPFKKLF